MNQRPQEAGYELLTRRHLEHASLTFCAANIVQRGGELDLMMRDCRTCVFIEVRYRRNDTFIGAAESVTYRKQQRLLHAATVWLAGRGVSFNTLSYCFNIIAITRS